MAQAPRWKVYSASGAYQGAVKDVELGAVLVAFLGDGATIRDGHRDIVWTEGQDGQAAESYDEVVETIARRA